ncbi:PAS domain-containing protein [Desulfovibrio aminophilus]|nr:histidine kinase dimerization/phosphoacceptor domain -containing protein [Desulfovibrio aminophilus]MCM0754939.1 PAS domain-containing protein [Desulfovibrio aminophilus]
MSEHRPEGGLAAENAALRERVARLERLLDEERRLFASGAVAVFDCQPGEDWRVESVFGNVAGICGRDPREFLLGRPFASMVHPDDLARVQGFLAEQEARGRDGFVQEYRIVHPDGAVRWVEDRTVIERGGDGNTVRYRCALQDITERKRFELAVLGSHRLMTTLFDGLDLSLYVADMETHEILYTNEHMRRLFGKPLTGGICYKELQDRDSPCPFCTNDIIRTLDGGIYRWEFSNPLVGRHAVLMDRVIRWPDGRDVRLEICLDITERRQAENALQARDAVLQAVSMAAEVLLRGVDWSRDMDGVLAALGRSVGVCRAYIFRNREAPDGTLLMDHAHEWCAPGVRAQIGNPDLQGMRYVDFCPRWAQVLGHGTPLHGRVADFPESERRILDAQEIKSLLVVPIFVAGAWWGFIGFDDCQRSRLWSSAELDALATAAGIIGGAIQRRHGERALRRALDEQKALFQEVHHRVKNNLQVVSSLLDMAARRLAPDPAAEALVDVRQRVRAMALIHAGLYGGPRLDRVDFAAYAADLYGHVSSLYPDAARRLSARFSMPPLELPLVKAVPCALILNEALTNVFRHAYPGGRSGEVRVGWDRPAPGRVRMFVADDGVGLPEGREGEPSCGMGFKLLRGLAGHQLDGRLELRGGAGLEVTVEFTPEPGPEGLAPGPV